MTKKHTWFFCLLAVLFILSSCTEDNPLIPPAVEDHSPMWPMIGYNARHTGNPNSIRVNMLPVNEGKIYWVDTLDTNPSTFNNASENAIDALGNIYHFSNRSSDPKLIKIRPDGSIIWSKDSVYIHSGGGFALSNNEMLIYFQDVNGFKCIDSSGNTIWAIEQISSYVSMPVIGRDGTIYVILNNNLTAVTPDGNIKWQVNSGGIMFGRPALDRGENLYVINESGTNYGVLKFNKFGAILWRYENLLQNYNYFSVVIDGFNNIYLNSNKGLVSLDKNGNLRWIKNYGINTVPAITKNNIIITDSTKYIIALDTGGSQLWKSVMITDMFIEHSIVLDDNDNSYFFFWASDQDKAASLSITGNLRWACGLPTYWYGNPGPTLSPLGYIFGTRKRPFLIYCIK
ncbi:MAG: hypothetical protein EHM58_06050 [Ignavibacteriae bacterium]|nr:MAG: hypothetical protein EHM58_06050 [Ignavibacteriota bacterium]